MEPGLEKRLAAIEQQAVQIRKCIGTQGRFLAAIKHASLMLAELKASELLPKQYYELYIACFDALTPLIAFLKENHKNHHLADMYEKVQYVDAVVPRLYLMISVGSAYLAVPDAPVKEILRDMLEMCRGVQHPVRGLFLRYYLTQRTRDYLPVSTSRAQASRGTLADSIQFTTTNFVEMNKLWVRLQYQGHSSERLKRLAERKELQILVGSCIVRLSQLEGLNIIMFSERIFPLLVEQIVQCRDVLAQEYLMDVICQSFPVEFHFANLEKYLDVLSNLNPQTSAARILLLSVERVIQYQEAQKLARQLDSDLGGDEKGKLENIENGDNKDSDKDSQDKDDSKDDIKDDIKGDSKDSKDNEDSKADSKDEADSKDGEKDDPKDSVSQPEDSEKQGSETSTKDMEQKQNPQTQPKDTASQKSHTESKDNASENKDTEKKDTENSQKSESEPEDTEESLSTKEPRVLVKDALRIYLEFTNRFKSNLSLVDRALLVEALARLCYVVDSEDLSRIDILIGIVAEATDKDQGEANDSVERLLLSLLRYIPLLKLISSNDFRSLVSHENKRSQAVIANRVLAIVLEESTSISEVEVTSEIFKLFSVVSKDAGNESLHFAEVVLLLNNSDFQQAVELLKLAQKFLRESGVAVVQRTYPALVTSALRVLRSHPDKDLTPVIYLLRKTIHDLATVGDMPEKALSLYVLAANGADQVGAEQASYEFYVEAFSLYEESISDSKAQYHAICVLCGSLQRTRSFSQENYDTLASRCAQYGQKLLRKPDQCRAIYNASHLWMATELPSRSEQDEQDLYSDPGEVLKTLQRALRVADASMDVKVSLELFVEVLNRYLYFYDRQCTSITASDINSLINVIKTNIRNNADVASEISGVEGFFKRTLEYIASRAKDTSAFEAIEL